MFHPHFSILYFLLAIVQIASAALQMPDWLKERTGLTSWPAYEAPYIAEAHHNLAKIKYCVTRAYGECNYSRSHLDECSYDCDHCIRPMDITSCDILSQTFDDGPSLATPKLLDSMKMVGARTSFFLLGVNVVEQPQIAMREFKEGHLLGVHTWSHKFLPALTNEEIFAELQWCIWAVNASTGCIPKYFRPPYGGVDDRIRDIANQLSLKTVLWDRDTFDWRLHDGSRTKSELLGDVDVWTKDHPSRRWFQLRAPKAKGLILEHDLSDQSVSIALEILSTLKASQKRVDQCRREY